MELPCGGCGKYVPGDNYNPSMGCFFCWSSQHSPKYKGYWDEADKVTPPAIESVMKTQTPSSYEPTYNPYHRTPIESTAVQFPPTEKAAVVVEPDRRGYCIHLDLTNETGQVPCQPCGGVRIKTFACEIYGSATLAKKVANVACCVGCPDFLLVAKLPDGNPKSSG